MEFHTRTGTNIVLTDGNTRAERSHADQTYNHNGTLFSSHPLDDDCLFEVEIKEKVTMSTLTQGLMIGLTAQNPDSINTLPTDPTGLSESWIFWNGRLFVYGSADEDDQYDFPFAPAKFDLAVGTRVGVLRSSLGAVHLYIDGVDQGSCFSDVPADCYAVVDILYAKGMVSIKLTPWTIPTFRNLMQSSEPGFSVSSNRLMHKALPGIVWFLKVYPNGYKKANRYVAVELCVEKSDKKSSAAAPVGMFAVSFSSAAGNGGRLRFSPRAKFVPNAVCVMEKFAAQKAIDKLCGDGSLVVSGEVLMEAALTVQSEYLRQLFDSGAFSDFKIKVENEPIEFAVHRNVVGVASSVMLRMLHSECDEPKENEMTIKQSSLDAVKAMLQFIYGDPLCFDNLEQLSIDVLKLADQYHLDELKNICEKSLSGLITNENALQLAELGYLYNTSELKKAVSQFVFDNKEIMSADAWTELEKRHCKLINELQKFVIDKLYEALSKK